MMSGSVNLRYKVMQKIGASSMSTVYKIWDTEKNRVLALKASAIYGERYSEASLAKEFLILSQCKHPGIVRALNFDIASEGGILLPGTLFFTMEYMRGKTLNEIRLLNYSQIHEALSQILEAIQVVHDAGIVYGDIKPHNVMVLEDPRKLISIKLFDFGLAVKEGERANGREMSGTFLYIAPEIVAGGTIDRRTDLYSLGAMLYELVTGVPPFQGKDAISIAYKHITELPIDPSSLNPSIPIKLRKLIMKLMEKDPGNRFQSVEEVVSFMGSLNVSEKDSFNLQILQRGE